jgi:hypothetical protein
VLKKIKQKREQRYASIQRTPQCFYCANCALN